MSSDIAIRVSNLSKCYQIYANPRDRLKQFVLPPLCRALPPLGRLFPGRSPDAAHAPLSTHHLPIFYREFWALNDVSFEVGRGETVGIIGRNGSGKSTLLQMICGTLQPTLGSVETRGRVAALLELGAGFNPEFTGSENVYMNGSVLGLTKDEIDARFDEIAAFADIGDSIEQPVKNYSSGMAVRLAFAVQAMIDPDIFIVDEALAVGDEKFQRKCFARLEKLKSRGTSILFVSHASGQITELCEKVLFLDHGERLMYSSAPNVIRSYQRLIYASDEEQKRLIQKYRAADQTGNVIEEINQADSTVTFRENFSDSFDTGLVPETTTSYPAQGAEIESIRIFDTAGNVVNVLHPGATYRFVVSGRFMNKFPGVNFGIHIKTISGVVITGQRYPVEGGYVEHIEAGKVFDVCFLFRMDLLPDVYFVGGGVWSNTEPICLHRIVDAIMFRVIPSNKQKSSGYVDFSAGEPLLKVV